MKEGNEDDKVMRPMFPRLHVNDTEKGGPRAPPRNKMALYEQLSIPSQKFNSSLPHHKPSTLAPSASLSQDGSDRKTTNSQFYLFQTVPTPNIEKTHSRSFDAKNLETRNLEPEGRLSDRMDNKSSHVASSDAQANSLNQDELSKRNNSFKAKYDDGDDFRVPTFVQSEANPCSKNTIVEVSMRDPSSASNIQKSYSATPNSPHQVSSPSGMPIGLASASDILSKMHEGNHVEHMPKEVIVLKEHRKKISTNLEDAGMLPGPSASDILSKRHVGNHIEHMPREVVRKEHRKQNSTNREDAGMLPGPSKLFLATSGGVTEANTSLLEKLGHQNTRIDTETCQDRASRELESLNNQDFLENRKASKLRRNTCSGTSLGNSHGSHDYKENVSCELRDADRSDNVSEDSMVDSISVLEISPDDVVGIIGPKQFWKARRAIVNQQRVFAIQVFELHRLIKVQKLFAASPHLLLEDTSTVKIQSKIANKCPPVASNNFQPIAQQKHGFSQKPNHNDDRPLEKAANPFPLQTQQERGPNQELGQLPVYVPHSGNLPTVPTGLDNRQNPWCFHPPANQWLIPVMSPSEGLVYKPYSGPCSPPTGFMAPLYGSCGQLGLPTGAGDLLNTTNSVPASNQQQNMGVLPGSPAMGPSYFSSPYAMAMVNPVNSTSAVEQFSPFCSARANGGKTLHSRGSRNTSFTRSDAFSGCPPKHNNASKDSELQASTASSPCDGPQGEGKDVLPLFPMAPAGERSCQPSLSSGREQQSHVIKVVPHNGRSAMESAARIFRSIQEQRQQYDM